MIVDMGVAWANYHEKKLRVNNLIIVVLSDVQNFI